MQRPRLRDDANVGARVRDILVAGASTRRYASALPEAAATVGMSKSMVSRTPSTGPTTNCKRKSRRWASSRRIGAHLELLIAEVIRDGYLTKLRAKKEEVVKQVGLRCSSERLTPPSRKAILARVRALDAREVVRARLQASEAAALVDPVPGDRVDNVLDVVQIDHTPVDVIVVAEAHRLPIGSRCERWPSGAATRCTVTVSASASSA